MPHVEIGKLTSFYVDCRLFMPAPNEDAPYLHANNARVIDPGQDSRLASVLPNIPPLTPPGPTASRLDQWDPQYTCSLLYDLWRRRRIASSLPTAIFSSDKTYDDPQKMTLKAVDEEIFNTQKKDRRKFLVHLPDQRLWFQCQIGVHKNDTNNPKISTEMVCVPKQEVNRKWCRWIGMDKKNWTGFRTICLGSVWIIDQFAVRKRPNVDWTSR
eukprot:GEMP01060243.1.p1 GENE.GEMP01060243.1~~GEMP01060243.1.p1  ORF type:complete len:213 (+),score=35.81 GEMP01060243.1:211-849(+)